MYATPGKGKEDRMAYVLESDKLERAMEILKKAIEPITPDKKEKNTYDPSYRNVEVPRGH